MFLFSSRRRHTRGPRDWSSDVCSADLGYPEHGGPGGYAPPRRPEQPGYPDQPGYPEQGGYPGAPSGYPQPYEQRPPSGYGRSEERRVGKVGEDVVSACEKQTNIWVEAQ